MRARSKGFVCEVFRSIQGEGIYVGVLQVFVRLAGCSARCSYCDTPQARERSSECVLRGDDENRRVLNPVGSEELESFVRRIAGRSVIHSVSITGGEPLEQAEFLLNFLPRCRQSGFRLYLETNGLHEEVAREIACLVDIVSLDIKLPSLCRSASLEVYPGVLRAFSGSRPFCKVVVAEGVSWEQFEEAARIVADFDREMPFVIQPATVHSGSPAIELSTLLCFHAFASRHLRNVRIIPQCHRILGVA